MTRCIYLDHNATTPIDPGVVQSMSTILSGTYGNPSSVHSLGRAARAILDDCRYRVAAVWQCKPSEVIFTSGGTESVNLALRGAAQAALAKGNHIITSAIEHHAVLHCLQNLAQESTFDLTILPVGSEGRVDPLDLRQALRPSTTLVSIMVANNETGVIQPFEEIAAICREAGVLFHTDAIQAFGKLPFSSISQFGAHLVSACAHKFYGPKGAGALYCESPLRLAPIFRGGAQENEARPGTENLAAIVGLCSALEQFTPSPVFDASLLAPLCQLLSVSLDSLPGVTLIAPQAPRLANTVSFTVDGWDSISLLAALDLEGVCASSGSACSVGSLEPSHVLLAMGYASSQANALIRFSLGRDSTEKDVLDTVAALSRILASAPTP